MEFTRCLGCMRELEGKTPCPHCGFDIEKYETAFHQLRPETILNGKYVLGRVLGEGGFGISYLGWDLNLEYKVAIKEYYPVTYVTRQAMYTPTVTMLSGGRQEFYQKGLSKFVDEAKSLAKFSELPGIVHVRDYFEENGTAYIVMEFAEGNTLKNILTKTNSRFPVEQALTIMRPVIESLGEVHKKGLIHRDISPDNMILNSKGEIKLLDFGAARNYMFGEEKSLSVILKPGFTPAEQYSSRGGQGPWTDVYALCATIYRAVTGVTPPESLDRMNGEELKTPSSMGIAITPQQEAALMKGLAIDKKDRFASMEELENALYQVKPGPDPEPGPDPAPKPSQDSRSDSGSEAADTTLDSRQKPRFKEGRMRLLVLAVFAVLCFIGITHMGDGGDTDTELSEKDFQCLTKTRWTSANGNQYEGFKNESGRPNGTGKVTYENGDQYEGNFSDGYRQGHGKYTWENGTVYVGNYVDGKKSGFGILDSSDTVYIGEWDNNQRDGLGILYDKKEKYETGVWKENKKVEDLKGVPLDHEDGYIYISSDQELSDKAVIVYADGTTYIGEVKASVQKSDGWGVRFSSENIKNYEYYEGIFGQDGDFRNLATSYYDHIYIIMYMSEEDPKGPCVVVEESGNRSAGVIENGKLIGNWIRIDGDDGSVEVGTIGENSEIVPDADQEQWFQGETMCIGTREDGKVKGEHVVIEKDGLCAIRNVEEEFLMQFPSFYDGRDSEYFIWGNTAASGKEWDDGALYAYMQKDGRIGLKVYRNGKWEQAE